VGGLAFDLTSRARVVDRLSTEFASHLDVGVVVSTVRRCRRELDIIHGPAPPNSSNASPANGCRRSPPRATDPKGTEDDPRHARAAPTHPSASASSSPC
jgi:hypothetical protein